MRLVRIFSVGIAVLGMYGCSGGLTAPPAGSFASAQSAAATSAFRALTPQPNTVSLQTIAQRTSQGLSAFPAPLSAFPAPLSAFPAPLSAFPALGSGPAATQDPLCAVSQQHGPGAGCHAVVRNDVPVQPAMTPVQLLSGMLPGWLNAIYNLPPLNAQAGSNNTVAVVVAYDDPAAEADLAVYRSEFGLPPCTSANRCFQKIAQDGSTNYPAFDAGWAVETATDIETVSAVCPGCNLLLVEASSSNIPDLAAAVDTAAAHGASVISNSYGVPEAADNVQYDSHYNHPGIPVVVAAGDKGYGVMFPASSEYVIAVGGTTLYQSGNGIAETAWPLTSAGCSAYIAKPSWQTDAACPHRMMNDIAMVADPATGMAIYDSVLNGTSGGWTVIGGTSIGAPIIAAIIATGNDTSKFYTAQRLYKPGNKFFTVTAGSDGSCSPAYFCSASKGYDGPTGLGSPNGNQPLKS